MTVPGWRSLNGSKYRKREEKRFTRSNFSFLTELHLCRGALKYRLETLAKQNCQGGTGKEQYSGDRKRKEPCQPS